MNSHDLPPELWLLIFSITLPSTTDPYADERRAFRPSPGQENKQHHELAVQLALVCRTWHALLLPTLCRDVKLWGRPIPLPQHVRRVVLPYIMTTMDRHPHNRSTVVEHLRQCTQIETLCRPPALAIGKPLPGPPAIALPSLRRLEWCHLSTLDRSGGINSLVDVLSQSPNLQYLFVSGLFCENISLNTQRHPHLPALATLRLRYHNDNFLQCVGGWSLPVLKTVILDVAPSWYLNYNSFYSDFWGKLGRNLVRVELGKDTRFSSADYISPCLQACPALQDLGYYVFFTAYPRGLPLISHRSLRRVRLHAAPNGTLDHQEMWHTLRGHFVVLNHPGMERLTTFIRHGKWDTLVQDPQWLAIEDEVTARGRGIV